MVVLAATLCATASLGVSEAAAASTPLPDSVGNLGAPALGDLSASTLNKPLVGMAVTPDHRGYWLLASDGGVFRFGDAVFHGSTGALVLNEPVVGMAADPQTGGYWLVAGDGGIFSFDAPFFGSLGALHLNAPIVGMAATPDGRGYWLVASDGGVFAFGDASFRGSLGSVHLNRPIVAMAADNRTGGYWLVASDGGVFSFDAPFLGSAGSEHLNQPIVAMSPTLDDGGYWLVAADGGVFTYGNAAFEGSRLSTPEAPAIGVAAGPTGYWVAYGHDEPGFVLGGPPPALAASPGGGPGTFSPTAAGVLSGDVVTIDPGHNGDSYTDLAYIDAPIWNGRETEACDTTGTETDAGYTEAQFNFNVAEYVTALLRAEGATVVLTRTTNTGIGPCVTERAAIGNAAHSQAALSIHADGGPPGGRGFAILEPVADGINNAIVGPSAVLGTDLRNAFGTVTGEPVSTYSGVDAIVPRDDLGGINLSTVPKVFIECANMRNATDAGLLVTPTWQAQAATGIAQGLTTYLTGP